MGLEIIGTNYIIEFYKKKYETLSEKTNNLTEIVKKSFENIYTPLNKTKNEIKKLLSQFEDLMKNLSIPLLSYEKIFNHNNNFRNLNENEDDEDKLNIINKIEEYKNDTERLNTLYNEYFNYINKTAGNISEEINEMANTVVDLQNKIETGKSNFLDITKDLSENNDIQSIHSNLIDIKNDFNSIQSEVITRKNSFDRRGSESNDKNLGVLYHETNETINNLKSNYFN